MKTYPFHFYLFRGKRSDLVPELEEMLQPDSRQRYSIWEPLEKNGHYVLIVVFGMPLALSYCLQRDIWKSDELVFKSYFNCNRSRFIIHGSKEIPEIQ